MTSTSILKQPSLCKKITTAKKNFSLVVVGKGLLVSPLGVYAPSLKSVNASLLKTKSVNERWSKSR